MAQIDPDDADTHESTELQVSHAKIHVSPHVVRQMPKAINAEELIVFQEPSQTHVVRGLVHGKIQMDPGLWWRSLGLLLRDLEARKAVTADLTQDAVNGYPELVEPAKSLNKVVT